MSQNSPSPMHDVDPASIESAATTKPSETTSAPGTVDEDADPAATSINNAREDLRRHADMLSRLVAADIHCGGLLVLQGRRADPLSGYEQRSALQIGESGILHGLKHIPIRSRKLANYVADAVEEITEDDPHHLYAALAIMGAGLPEGRSGLETDIVGVLGLVACFEGIADYRERLPLEPDYVLAWGDVTQAFYLLEEPALPAEAKPVAIALQEHAGCDRATAELAHGWWIAGSVRYGPKREEPVRVVKRWHGESRTRLVDLRKALGLRTETLRPEAEGWTKPLRFNAFHGLAGELVNKLLPHTEAAPAALLVHLLVAFGNAVGRAPHARVEADLHGANLYAAFVGDTGAGRKGTAWGRIRELFTVADQDWAQHCVKGGMSSGEGVIEAIRDPLEEKRLFLREPELSRMFRAMNRPGNTLRSCERGGMVSILRS